MNGFLRVMSAPEVFFRPRKFPFVTSSVVGTVSRVGEVPLTAVPDSQLKKKKLLSVAVV